MAAQKSRVLSLLLHILAILCLGWFQTRYAAPPLSTLLPRERVTPLLLEYRPPPGPPTGPSAGGANAALVHARQGAPPPKAPRPFLPAVVRPDPKLPMPVAIAFDAPPVLATADIGDPLGKLGSNTLGTGGTGGIGNSGCCGRIGDHSGGPGFGGEGGPSTTPPVLIYRVEPEFSEEARKAKYQGTVILLVEIDVSGHTSHFRVVSSLGMGLDEKAIAAVAQWRFRPAIREGQPVVSNARVEVTFHLL